MPHQRSSFFFCSSSQQCLICFFPTASPGPWTCQPLRRTSNRVWSAQRQNSSATSCWCSRTRSCITPQTTTCTTWPWRCSATSWSTCSSSWPPSSSCRPQRAPSPPRVSAAGKGTGSQESQLRRWVEQLGKDQNPHFLQKSHVYHTQELLQLCSVTEMCHWLCLKSS